MIFSVYIIPLPLMFNSKSLENIVFSSIVRFPEFEIVLEMFESEMYELALSLFER